MPQSMTPQENFRFGFLLRCAEEGCDRREIESRVKMAAGKVAPLINALWSYGMLPLHMTALGLGGAAVAGPAVGYTAAKLQNQSIDPEAAKRQELIDALKLQTDRARQRASQRSYRQPAPTAPKLLE